MRARSVPSLLAPDPAFLPFVHIPGVTEERAGVCGGESLWAVTEERLCTVRKSHYRKSSCGRRGWGDGTAGQGQIDSQHPPEGCRSLCGNRTCICNPGPPGGRDRHLA